VIVADSSAWVELLRETQSQPHRTLRRLLEENAPIAVTEVVVLELLAGAASSSERRRLRSILLAFPVLPLRGLAGYEAAAELYASCRRAGETVRRLLDCVIAVPAIEAGASVLHANRDFEAIARHSPLRIEPLDA
jgi:predicted nucleic acid-binding protein